MEQEKQDNIKKHLVIYLPTLVGGGAERVMMNLATGFIKHGVKVDFVLAQREGAFMTAFPNTIPLLNLIINNENLDARLPAYLRWFDISGVSVQMLY